VTDRTVPCVLLIVLQIAPSPLSFMTDRTVPIVLCPSLLSFMTDRTVPIVLFFLSFCDRSYRPHCPSERLQIGVCAAASPGLDIKPSPIAPGFSSSQSSGTTLSLKALTLFSFF
jgi:hypothetical protein